ncbi:hypothetical protein ACFLIM_26315 [Nonomuraea sp. M3C6]|uniref:Secreted protein n=1 Tax=Nonomuraea marmarensis TaxID=3351344 RepID=A0ABW7AI56_9ACTN
MERRNAVLVVGVAMALGLGGSGALAASADQQAADDPCRTSATLSPADAAKIAAKKEAAAKDGRAGDRTDKPQEKGVGVSELAQALSDELGVSLDRATSAAEQLFALSGVDPDSAEFAAVANRLGVSAERLHQALKNFKRAASGLPEKGGSSGKSPGS